MTAAWPDWQFFALPRTFKQKNHSQEGYFRSESMDSQVVALVREAVQNSLDADADPHRPVHLRIFTSTTSGALPYATVEPYFRNIWPSATATSRPDLQGEPCQYVVIEDFGTTGLLGDPAETPQGDTKNSNNFMHFFRVEGASPKREASRGRRGVGKIVFPMSSLVGAFFGLTIRKDDAADKGAGLLLGQAAMEVHAIDGSTRDGDGWWGEQPSPDSPVLPISDPDLIAHFRADWHIGREPGEPGLSLVLPFLEQAWSVSDLLEPLIINYYWAILSERLTATIEDHDGTVKNITAATLATLVEDMGDSEAKERVARDLATLEWVRETTATELPVAWKPEPSWGTVTIDDEDRLKTLQESFLLEKRAFVNIPIRVATQDGKIDQTQSLKVVLVSEPGLSRPASFVRGGMVISEAGKSALSGYRGMVLIDDPKLSMMVGDAEGAAHTGWSASEKTFKGKYKEGRSWLAVIKESPLKTLRLLSGQDEERDESGLQPFFPEGEEGVSGSPSAPTQASKPDGATQVGTIPDGPKPPPPAPRQLVVSPTVPGGCRIVLSNAAKSQGVTAATITFAYKKSRGNSFKAWQPEDFRLTNPPEGVSIDVQGASWTAVDNRLELSNIVASEFRVELKGFNPSIDLDVRSAIS